MRKCDSNGSTRKEGCWRKGEVAVDGCTRMYIWYTEGGVRWLPTETPVFRHTYRALVFIL